MHYACSLGIYVYCPDNAAFLCCFVFRQKAFYLFGIGTDLEAIQFSYFLGAIKALTSQLLNSKNKIPEIDI